MNQANPYAEFVEEIAPKDEAMESLYNLVALAKAQEAELVLLAEDLKKKTEAARDVLQRQIPELMDNMGMKKFENKDGLKIEVKDEVHASISQERKVEAHKWLEDNGHAGLIKREISVAFNREQAEEAKLLIEELSKKYAAVTEEQKVHPSTLKAWAKEQLESGKDVPTDTFGIHKNRVAKISAAKKK